MNTSCLRYLHLQVESALFLALSHPRQRATMHSDDDRDLKGTGPFPKPVIIRLAVIGSAVRLAQDDAAGEAGT